MTQTPIRDAATIILSRQGHDGPEVLMGQRGASAAFMPNKFVFPGGAVDRADTKVALGGTLDPLAAHRLAQYPQPSALEGLTPNALAATAIRELWEETGLALAGTTPWTPPEDASWQAMAALGLRPEVKGLRYVFRAITPPGRPRRFDARFFLIDAAAIQSDLDDFSRAEDELSHLQWIPLIKVRNFDLPFVTEVVLAEVAQVLRHDDQPPSVPFFDNSGDRPIFRRIT